MRKMIVTASAGTGLVILFGLMAIGSLRAGGFQIAVEPPDAKYQTQGDHVVAVVRTFGCHQPSDASLTATAEGLVDGRRQAIPLKIIHRAETGVYTISRQWPTEGVWLLAITGKMNTITSSTLVKLGSDGALQTDPSGATGAGRHGKFYAPVVQRALTAEEIYAALQAQAEKTKKSSQTAQRVQ